MEIEDHDHKSIHGGQRSRRGRGKKEPRGQVSSLVGVLVFKESSMQRRLKRQKEKLKEKWVGNSTISAQEYFDSRGVPAVFIIGEENRREEP